MNQSTISQICENVINIYENARNELSQDKFESDENQKERIDEKTKEMTKNCTEFMRQIKIYEEEFVPLLVESAKSFYKKEAEIVFEKSQVSVLFLQLLFRQETRNSFGRYL